MAATLTMSAAGTSSPWAALGPAPSGEIRALRPYAATAEAAAARRARTFRRRRAVALVLVCLSVAALWAGARQVVAPSGGESAPASGGRADEVRSVAVRPGDTVWSLARTLQPGGDVRPLVDSLVAANGGTAVLQAGQRLVVPG